MDITRIMYLAAIQRDKCRHVGPSRSNGACDETRMQGDTRARKLFHLLLLTRVCRPMERVKSATFICSSSLSLSLSPAFSLPLSFLLSRSACPFRRYRRLNTVAHRKRRSRATRCANIDNATRVVSNL